MSAEPISSPTTWAEEVLPPIFGVYDEDKGDFVAVFLSLRDAQDREQELELAEHDFGARGVMDSHAKYYPRYSVDQLPASHPLADEVR